MIIATITMIRNRHNHQDALEHHDNPSFNTNKPIKAIVDMVATMMVLIITTFNRNKK